MARASPLAVRGGPVGEFGPDHDGYFGWLAQKGFAVPANRDDIWLPEGEAPIMAASKYLL